MDELVKEIREMISIKPGKPAREDFEYERNGTANIFIMTKPLAG